MFKVDPDTLYSLEDLRRELAAVGLSERWLLDEVRPAKVARSQWLGSDILEALREHSRQRAEQRPVNIRRGRKPKREIELIETPRR